MRNFAEEMVYWYFRLNGFFLLDNFVLHNDGLDSTQSADIDILAIRQKYTYENVGGREADKHELLFRNFDDNKNIGILCEVKAGRITPNDICLTRIDRLKYGLERMGFSSHSRVNELVPELSINPVVTGNYHQVGKVLITDDGRDMPGFICISLEEIHKFLKRHLRRYLDPKSRSKHFFPSPVIQQIIWEIEQDAKNKRTIRARQRVYQNE
ncbi:hypothetical protein AB432_018625 [Brevibacillus brevis]|uniref:Uncharacterized protein n=1 Tax=Brevibacillus brevis TaxID=1393 RepID=A0A2Z4MKE9_BREBE|nr:hypothetical protein [Brevibacillus brevis]AWX56938.1 hypothetical protein AB432_018625 [Brevibacillus brevis]